jgi:hypothetical protein
MNRTWCVCEQCALACCTVLKRPACFMLQANLCHLDSDCTAGLAVRQTGCSSAVANAGAHLACNVLVPLLHCQLKAAQLNLMLSQPAHGEGGGHNQYSSGPEQQSLLVRCSMPTAG